MVDTILMWLNSIHPLVLLVVYLAIGFIIGLVMSYFDPVDGAGAVFAVTLFWGLGIPLIALFIIFAPFFLLVEYVNDAGKKRQSKGNSKPVPKQEEEL